MDESEQQEQRPWQDLPPQLLESIGGGLTSVDVNAASLVCKSWGASVPHGLSSLELDMHPDPNRWSQRLERVAGAMRGLRSATVFINSNVSSRLLTCNLEAIKQQFASLEELNVRLGDAYELGGDAARALGSLQALRALTLVGGSLAPGAATQLLLGLTQSHALAKLVVLPAVRGGFGDEELRVLGGSGLRQLTELEFRAHRLTSEGVEALSLLPRVSRLAISSLEADMGYELSSLARMATLQQLELSLDQGGAGSGAGGRSNGVMGPLAPLAHLARGAPGLPGQGAGGPCDGGVPGGGAAGAGGGEGEGGAPTELALHFRWTERVSALLRACQAHLGQSLTALDMGSCRVSDAAVFAALSEMTALKHLQLSMFNNGDQQVLCELSHFSRLAALRSLQLRKQAAYFPEHRAFRASSLSVPITPGAMAVLGERWASTLTELRLSLCRWDFTSEGLRMLSRFSRLTSLAVLVEGGAPAHAAPAAAGSSSAAAAAAEDGVFAGWEDGDALGLGSLQAGEGDLGAPDDGSEGRSDDEGEEEEEGGGAVSHSAPQGSEGAMGLVRAGLAALGAPLASGPQQQGGAGDGGSGPLQRRVRRTRSGGRLGAGGASLPRFVGAREQAAGRRGRLRAASGLPGAAVVVDVGALPPGLVNLELAGVWLVTPSAPAGAPALPRASPWEEESGATAAPVPLQAAWAAGGGPGGGGASSRRPRALPPIEALSLESCGLRPGQLASLARGLAPSLSSLQLVNLSGLNDVSVASLAVATRLTSLVVTAPGNRHVTQGSLAALSSLRALKCLSWDTDDMTNAGPVPSCLAPFTGLRLLSLSCTPRTLSCAVPGGLQALTRSMPFVAVALVGGMHHAQDDAQEGA